MAQPQRPQPGQKPMPKIDSTRLPPAEEADNADEHEERAIDEAVDESFPASDPPAIQSPSSTLVVKKHADDGRDVPDPDKPE